MLSIGNSYGNVGANRVGFQTWWSKPAKPAANVAKGAIRGGEGQPTLDWARQAREITDRNIGVRRPPKNSPKTQKQ